MGIPMIFTFIRRNILSRAHGEIDYIPFNVKTLILMKLFSTISIYALSNLNRLINVSRLWEEFKKSSVYAFIPIYSLFSKYLFVTFY